MAVGHSSSFIRYHIHIRFGTGMVGLIFIHELGHALMMRNLGVPAGPMVFIPFMGASVEMRKHPSNGDLPLY